MAPVAPKRSVTVVRLPTLLDGNAQHLKQKESTVHTRQFSRQELKLSEERRSLRGCAQGTAMDAFLKRKQSSVLQRPASMPVVGKPTSMPTDACNSVVPNPPPAEVLSPSPSSYLVSPSRARSVLSLSRSFAAQAPKLGMESPVRSIVSQLLPAVESPKKTPKPRRSRLLSRARAVQVVTALSESHPELPPTPGGCSSAIPLQKKQQLLGDFRARLLQHFRSVHDAFNQFDCIAKDKALSYKEFQQAVMGLGICSSKEAKVLFKTMDTDESGEVSLTEFLLALVDVSSEALLWELRVRLDSDGIRLNSLHKIFDLIRRHDRQHRPIKEDDIKEEKERRLRDRELWRDKQLSRSDWSKLGAALGLTIIESERLFLLIDKDQSGTIDLEEMFAAMRAVAPDVTLERFVTKVLVHHGTLPEAFRSHARHSPDSRRPVIGLNEFLSLAAMLGVNDENAQHLWEALDIASRIDADDAMDEDLFISQMKAWAPTTALDGLREEICEQFGNIAEGRRTLHKCGVPLAGVLSAASFEAGLRAAGVTHCDAELVLSTVSSSRQASPTRAKGVTLDEVMKSLGADSVLASPGKLKKKARVIIGNDMGPYWQQIVALKNDVRRGLSDVPRAPCPEKGDKLFHIVQDRLSQLKEGQGQNMAYKGMMGLHQKLSQKRSKRSSGDVSQRKADLSVDDQFVKATKEQNEGGSAFFLTE